MMNSPAELVFLDSNIFIYAEARDEVQHEEAKPLRDLALTGQISACISPQVLSEFFSVLTHEGPRGPEKPLAPGEAAALVRKYYESEDLVIIYPGPQMIEQMLASLEAHPISGARVHDVRLAATMAENGVSKIVTYDQGLFSQLPGIEVLGPSEFLQDQIRKEDGVREIEGDEDQT